MTKPNWILGLIAAAGLVIGACGQKSDAERAGDNVGEAVENVEEGITNDGPKEDAKEAVEKAGDEVEDRTD